MPYFTEYYFSEAREVISHKPHPHEEGILILGEYTFKNPQYQNSDDVVEATMAVSEIHELASQKTNDTKKTIMYFHRLSRSFV